MLQFVFWIYLYLNVLITASLLCMDDGVELDSVIVTILCWLFTPVVVVPIYNIIKKHKNDKNDIE